MRKYLSIEMMVGLFALAGLAIIIYMSLEVSETNIARGKAKRYIASFDTVTGIVNKSPIETAGIRVGYIDSIALENAKAKVELRVIPNLVVYKNAILWIKDRGILGDKYLKLDPGTPDYPVLAENDEIKNCFSESDMDKLMSSLGNAAGNIDKLMKSLGEGGKGDLSDLFSNFRELSKNLNEMLKTNRSGIDQTIANLAKVTESLKIALGDVNQAKEVGDNLRDTLKKFNEAADSISKIAAKINKGEGTIGKLVNDDSTVKKLNSAMDGVNDYLDSAKKIQTGIRYRGEFLTNSKVMQNMVAIKIQPKPDKYLMLELMDAPVGRTRVTDTTVVIPPDNTIAAQTKTVETTDQFLFSLEVAKRFYDLNLRFGVIRNRGGAGFDYYFFKDTLEFSFEAFDFSRFDNHPHFRSYATLTVFKYLLLTGGIDDIADKEGNRNGFFGAGLSFTDNDLKTILASFKLPGF